jgi:hypothetical protein
MKKAKVVMAGLVPAIHVFTPPRRNKAWMPGTSPGMTVGEGSLSVLMDITAWC